MLKLYASTVIIWAFVLWASDKIAMPFVEKNGWLDTPRLDDGGDDITFIVALVPVFRLVVLVGIWLLIKSSLDSYTFICYNLMCSKPYWLQI